MPIRFIQTIPISFKHFAKMTITSMMALTVMSACQTTKVNKSKDNKVQERGLLDSSLASQVIRGAKTDAIRNPDVEQANKSHQLSQDNSQIGYIPTLAATPEAQSNTAGSLPKIKVKQIDAFVRPLPVPEFIDAVFGGMLETPYITGPEVALMTDVVQLRSSGEMKSTDFFKVISTALEQYGVRIIPENGTYQIIKDSSLRAKIPKFIKSRARQSTRGDLRPVVQFVELRALQANSLVGILKTTFQGQKDRLRIETDPRSNYIILSGLPSDVDAALEIINEIDELNYAGTQVQRYTPQYWSATDLSVELQRALKVEGWQVTTNPELTRTIFLLPIEYSNDLLIFTKTLTANKRVLRWINELDRPIQGGDTEQIYIYQVRNVDASILSETVNSVLLRQSIPSNLGTVQTDQGNGGQVTVDPIGNRIIFTGTANEYSKLITLLEKLDTPAPEVLIEVQIAEVTLTDSTSSGVEFLVNDLGGSVRAEAGTLGGLGLGASGLNVAILTDNVDVAVNAFASNRRVEVLSTPVLVARSGGAASIQVGSDVPIITSQSAANTQIGGTSDILQSVEYRSTGVLLTIEPIVFSDNRIDLTISQEVSSTLDVSNGSISSPTISNRTVDTQLSLEDGATAVLGGLIQENVITDDNGIPFLKDLPLVGKVFSIDSYSVDRTELVVLITAYVLRGQADKSQFVNTMRDRVDRIIADDSPLVTLKPRDFN